MHQVEGVRGTPSRPAPSETAGTAPVICFSHLGWYFVFQRPHHLMSRAARTRAVFFWEEPLYEERDGGMLELSRSPEGVVVLRPRLPSSSFGHPSVALQRQLLDGLVAEHGLERRFYGTIRPRRSRSRRTFRTPRSSMTAWTNCRRFVAPIRPYRCRSGLCSVAPTSCSRAV